MRLFEPAQIAGLSLKNRAVRSATNEHMGEKNGEVSDAMTALYETLAKNEVGLILTAHYCVDPFGRWDGTQIFARGETPQSRERLSRIPRACHEHGAKVVAQLNHAGMKAPPLHNGGRRAKGPSAGPSSDEMTPGEIEEIILRFVDAAGEMQKTGYDGVQIHAAHGYLLSEFLDPGVNIRSDRYGGDAKGRFTICREIIRGIKAACGEEFPVFIKINVNGTNVPSEEYFHDLLTIASECEASGVDVIELSGLDIDCRETPEPYYIKSMLFLKDKIKTPFILTGGIYDADMAERALKSGAALVGMSRPLICEPDFLLKLKSGTQKRSRCIHCGQCFRVFKTRFVHCVLHEKEDPRLVALFKED